MAKQVAQDYQISKADILTSTGRVVDVKSSMVEFAVFENIERAFLTGTCAIVDTSNFVSLMKFTGTERLSVVVENSDRGVGTREMNFIMTRIERSEKANDHTDAYVFQLLEEHAFYSRSQKISRAYSGSPITIMNQILSGLRTNFGLDKSLLGADPVQQDMRVITPYISPLQAVEWIRDRTTTAQGLPFFVYSTIKNDLPYIKSLTDILKIQPWNKTPFTYSQASANADERGVFAIKSYENVETDDTLSAIQNGAVSARWEVLDIFKQKFNSEPTKNYNVDKLLPNNAVFDTKFEINGRPVTDYQPKVFYHVVASDMFGDKFTSYHDDNNLDTLVTKINNKGIRNAMFKNMVTIELSGLPFLINQTASVGTTINLAFLSKESGETTDSKRSGKYIITALRHTFTNAKHSVTAEVTKLTNEQTDDYKNLI
jgi:hypothetical protein